MRSPLRYAGLLVLFSVAAACGRTNLSELGSIGSSGGAGGAGGDGVGGSSSSASSSSVSSSASSSTSSSASSSGVGGGPAFCGDGKLNANEQCDDSNDATNDSCVFCSFASCGDGFVWAGVEACDDANASNSDACVSCAKAFCGDGFVFAGVEACDDGNVIDGDGCSSTCALGSCGNGIVDPGEQCDDGNLIDGDGCSSKCTIPVCGDGFPDLGEACDDGNASNADACVAGCEVATCGDGFVWAGVEACDDGNVIDGDGCSSKCKLPVCGDGVVDPGEGCDLGAANADRPALVVEQAGKQEAVFPIDRTASATVFYAYGSASSHTGYEAPLASRIFFYRDVTTGLLSLVFHHGADMDVTGQPQPQSTATFSISGLPTSIVVIVADDAPGELSKSSPSTVLGNWKFNNNSDGGVLGSFPFPGNFSVDLVPGFKPGISDWAWIDGDESLRALTLSQPIKIIANDTPSACRLDCTVPACGDGVLDGGEVCDDGNTVGGDGCAANCVSLN